MFLITDMWLWSQSCLPWQQRVLQSLVYAECHQNSEPHNRQVQLMFGKCEIPICHDKRQTLNFSLYWAFFVTSIGFHLIFV